MLDSPMLVDQNMVCGSNIDQRDHFPRIHLDASLFSGIHQICIPTFPFDPPTQRYIYNYDDFDFGCDSSTMLCYLLDFIIQLHTNNWL